MLVAYITIKKYCNVRLVQYVTRHLQPRLLISNGSHTNLHLFFSVFNYRLIILRSGLETGQTDSLGLIQIAHFTGKRFNTQAGGSLYHDHPVLGFGLKQKLFSLLSMHCLTWTMRRELSKRKTVE